MDCLASSYADIFIPGEPETRWPKLGALAWLSELHAKFWGKGIDQDESGWRQSLRQADQPEESNILPGSFVLDLGIDHIMSSSTWIRRDYVQLYDRCDEHCKKVIKKGSEPPSVVITGHPGIGKSHWIIYAIRRRLGERKPFLWYLDDNWFLFVQDGVFEAPQVFTLTGFRPYLWAFVDADRSSGVVPPRITSGLMTTVFTIFVTTPKMERWEPLEHSTTYIPLIMNPWSWEEMRHAAIFVYEFSATQLADAKNIYDKYGPTPCLCIRFTLNPELLSSYDTTRQATLSDLSVDQLAEAVVHTGGLCSDTFHSIFVIRREDDDTLNFAVEPITHSIRQQLKKRFIQEEWKGQLRAYQRFACGKCFRHFASLVFEVMVQLRLRGETALSLLPMVKQPRTRRRKTALWVSQSGNRLMPSPIPITFKPNAVVEYEWSTLSEFHSGVLYVPKPSDQVISDSFILTDKVLYIFRSTTAPSPETEGGLVDLISRPMLHSTLQRLEWHLVFVTPPGNTIVCPESSADELGRFWNKVKLCSAEFDPKTTIAPGSIRN